MATLAQTRTTQIAYPSIKLKLWSIPVARFFYSLIFILSGVNHFSSGTTGYAASAGVPYPDILVPVSGVFAIVGGLSILLGWMARAGAFVLLAFLIPVTIMMHPFWVVTDPQMVQIQVINFLKNLGLIGGAMLLAFYGAGPVSVDHWRSKHRRQL